MPAEAAGAAAQPLVRGVAGRDVTIPGHAITATPGPAGRSPLPDARPPAYRRGDKVPTLLVVASTLGGGLGAVVRDQADWYTAHGWRVVAAVPADAAPGPLAEIEHRSIPIPMSARDIRSMSRTIRELRTIIRSTRPDVIHCHGMRSFLVTRPATSRRPYVTLHGTGSVGSDPPGYRYVRSAGLRLIPLLARRAFNAGVERQPGWSFLPHASPRLQTLTSMPMPEHGDLAVIWMGNLVEQKRPMSSSGPSAARPSGSPSAGSSPGPADRPDLRRLAMRSVRRSNSPVGSTTLRRPSAPPAASPSSAGSRRLAFVVQEAMWVGRPVVCSPLPSLRWLVGDTGLYADDVESAAAAFVELADRDRAASLGERAGERIRSLLSPHDPWPHLETVFRRDLGQAV